MKSYETIILSALYARAVLSVHGMRKLTGSCHGLSVIKTLRDNGMDIADCWCRNKNTGRSFKKFMLRWN